MSRRRLIAASIAVAVVWHPAIGAPRPNARVGYLELVKESDGERLYREFVEGLQSHGYVEGRNLRMVRRSAGAQPERLRSLAPELAAAKVDVILATTAEAARSAKVGAPGIATVFVIAADPVLEGLVASLSRPQGYLTGLITRGEDLTAKRLQFLKDAFPRIRTVAIVGSNLSISRAAFDDAARRLQLSILQFPIHQFDDYRDAAAAIARSAADAVLVVEDADAVTNLYTFVRLMMATRRPVMFNADVFVEGEGWGLMAYGVSLRQQYRRAADIAVRLLEGTKPSDLPVEQPTSLRAGGQPSRGGRVRHCVAARLPDSRGSGDQMSRLCRRCGVLQTTDAGPNSDLGHDLEIDAQPCAQPDGPVRVFSLVGVGAARRLARTLGSSHR